MSMKKIVVTNDQGFSPNQVARLRALGDVTFYDSVPTSAEEYIQRVKGADIICSGTAGLQDAYPQLQDTYLTVAFVSVAFLDLELMAKNNVRVSNAPGSNRYAVAEWVMAMCLLLTRNLPRAINTKETLRPNNSLPELTPGLAGNNMTILGQGHVGTRVGELATAFGMNVQFFTRADDLRDSVADADIVVDALSSNETTNGLLDKVFFDAMKPGSYFASITRSEIVDTDALLQTLDSGRLAGAAMDCGGILVGDTDDPLYQTLLAHPKILVTPHIAYNTVSSGRMGAEIMIDNVEAYINGSPINVLN